LQESHGDGFDLELDTEGAGHESAFEAVERPEPVNASLWDEETDGVVEKI